VQIDAFLADSVANAENKLFVLGAGWDRLTVPAFPARHPRIGIAALITVPYDQTGRDHQLTVRLEDADGHVQPIGPPQPPTEPGGPERNPTGHHRHVRDHPVRHRGARRRADRAAGAQPRRVGVRAPGRFRFVLGVAGADVKNLAFRVSQAG
jgi:hypothetical protein